MRAVHKLSEEDKKGSALLYQQHCHDLQRCHPFPGYRDFKCEWIHFMSKSNLQAISCKDELPRWRAEVFTQRAGTATDWELLVTELKSRKDVKWVRSLY